MSDSRFRELTVEVDNSNHEVIKIEDVQDIKSQEFIQNQKLALQGHAMAQQNLGVFYYRGDGVPKDHKESLKYFKQAAEQGLAVSQYNVGCLYIDANDYKQGAFWFEKAAKQGHASAQGNLALILMTDNMGVDTDILKAIEWYQIAARQGHARSKRTLLRLANDKNMFNLLKTVIKDKLITEWPLNTANYSAENREIIHSILRLNAAEGKSKLKDVLIQAKLRSRSISRAQTTHVEELIGFYAAGLFKPKDRPKSQQQDQQSVANKTNPTMQR